MPLSRSPGEPFGVHGQHALAFQPDPAAARKIGQRLLVPHAAASDHLGDLLVREIVHHTDRAVLLAAELLRQLQQLLGGGDNRQFTKRVRRTEHCFADSDRRPTVLGRT